MTVKNANKETKERVIVIIFCLLIVIGTYYFFGIRGSALLLLVALFLSMTSLFFPEAGEKSLNLVCKIPKKIGEIF